MVQGGSGTVPITTQSQGTGSGIVTAEMDRGRGSLGRRRMIKGLQQQNHSMGTVPELWQWPKKNWDGFWKLYGERNDVAEVFTENEKNDGGQVDSTFF